MKRKCPRCNKIKKLSLFYKCHITKTGASVYCKDCTKIISAAQHLKTKDKRKTEISRQPISRRVYRQKRRALGLCVDCPAKVRQVGYVHCLKCHERILRMQREYGSSRPWVKANNHRLKNYGVTPERYVDMFFEQFGKCGICGKFFLKTPHLDHAHGVNESRGLLCSRCNTALWILEDSELFKKAQFYLAKYKKENSDGGR